MHKERKKMPFASKAQQEYLFAKKPEVAKKFAKKTPKKAYKDLPEHVRHKAMKRMASGY
jgi:hypothetical protein